MKGVKKAWIGAATFMGLATSVGITYARIVPGVDTPYNPAAYYSMTDISYADSPSVFFYRDLAGGGNIVLDPERIKKNVLSCLKYDEILSSVQKLFEHKKEDAKPFGNDGIKIGLGEAQRKTAALNLANQIVDGASRVFVDDSMDDEEFADRTQKKQILYLNDIYKNVAISAQQSIQNTLQRQALLQEALRRSHAAQGAMQAEQAKNDIQALMQEEMIEKNMIIENIAAMDAATQQYKMDKNFRYAREARDAIAQIQISDPYHPDAYEKRIYEKPKPLGLPGFNSQ